MIGYIALFLWSSMCLCIYIVIIKYREHRAKRLAKFLLNCHVINAKVQKIATRYMALEKSGELDDKPLIRSFLSQSVSLAENHNIVYSNIKIEKRKRKEIKNSNSSLFREIDQSSKQIQQDIQELNEVLLSIVEAYHPVIYRVNTTKRELKIGILYLILKVCLYLIKRAKRKRENAATDEISRDIESLKSNSILSDVNILCYN